MASKKHPTIKLNKEDLVIFSSKIIPGNEKKIFELFDLFAKQDIEVFTEKDHFVHVSGHPSQDELKEMYALARPKLAIPIHGEFIHTKVHSKLALECGVEKAITTENGTAVKIDNEDISQSQKVGSVESGYWGIDGYSLIDLNSEIVRERRKLAETGVIILSLNLDEKLNFISDPKIVSIGCYDLNNDDEAVSYIEDELTIILKGKYKELGLHKESSGGFFKKKKKKKKSQSNKKVIDNLQKTIRSRTLKLLEGITGKRPALEIIINIS